MIHANIRFLIYGIHMYIKSDDDNNNYNDIELILEKKNFLRCESCNYLLLQKKKKHKIHIYWIFV